jgi:hypothetical protein
MIHIAKWERHAGRTDRRMKWFKVQKTLIHKPAWRMIEADSARLLVDLWSLAADDDHPGEVHETLGEIAHTQGLQIDRTAELLADLVFARFITTELPQVVAAQALPRLVTKWGETVGLELRTENVEPRTQSGRETVTKPPQSTDLPAPVPATEGAAAALIGEMKAGRYPRREGSQNWTGASRALKTLLKAGATVEEIAEGVDRYAAFVRAKGEEGTSFVLMASTFLGRDQRFADEWAKPKKKGAPRLDRLPRRRE